MSILPSATPSLFSSLPPPLPVGRRRIGDNGATRQLIYDNVKKAAMGLEPVANARHTLSVHDVDYEGADHFPLKKQKEVLLSQGTLARKLRGTWRLTDNTTGQTVAERRATLAAVPHLTDRGTFILDGTEYSLAHQLRLRPGIYSRRKTNGELEAHVNVMPGKGASHRIFLDPQTGVFRVHVAQANIPLVPMLRALGTTDSELRQAWGPELYAANKKHDSGHYLSRLYERLARKPDPNAPEDKQREDLADAIRKMELDPEVTKRTLGKPYTKVDKDSLLATTDKLIALNRGEGEPDDRDHMAYQTVMGPEDLLAERVGKNRPALFKLLWQATFRNGLGHVQPGVFNKALRAAFLTSGLGQSPEGVNAAEHIDHGSRITRLGEGGLSGGPQAIPDTSRNVHSSQAFFLDVVKVPENEAIGVDLRLAYGVQKGTDGRIYAPFRDPQSGQLVYRSPQQIADLTVAFPGELNSGRKHVAAISNGTLKYVKRRDVDLVAPSMENTFSPLSNLTPMKSASKAQRVSMGARMATQALPLLYPESRWVRSAVPGRPDLSFDELYGRHMGAVHADQQGRVEKVTPDEVIVRYADGTRKTHDLYNNLAGPRKTGLHNTALVRPGDIVGPNQLLAYSNYTNKKGEAALGVNTRIAYVPYGGHIYEDSAGISESYAKRLTSEHYYKHQADFEDGVKKGKKSYIALFPGKYDRKALDRLDDDGVVKPGTVVNPGDPLILMAKERTLDYGKVAGSSKAAFGDNTITWDHHNPGVVTDVAPGRGGVNVVVKSYAPMTTGDKLSNSYGGKSVVSKIIPDDQMPHDKEGNPFDMVWSPLALLSRVNASWVVEGALGKVAAKTGKPYKISDFENIPNLTEFAMKELEKHGLTDTEDIYDPQTGRKIPNVFVGNNFIMKLHHQAEGKVQGRGLGGYSAEGSPLKGPSGQAKRLSLGDTNALLSHGALEVLRDSRENRSQQREDFWLAYMAGFPTPQAKVPKIYEKFVNEMKGSGINVIREGPRLRLMALTNKDVTALAGNRELQNAETVHWDKGLEPVKGGLFSPDLTGGHSGTNWAKVTLTEPLPNPVFAEPIRKLLGLTEKQYNNVIAGREELGGVKGPEALGKALGAIDVDKWLAKARQDIASGRKGARDQAVRRLSYLKSLKKTGQHPSDWMMRAVPVLPPMFRPVSLMAGNRGQLVSDPNYLYKDLFEANQNLKALKGRIGDVGDERLNLYHAFEAVTGLGDPVSPKNVERGVKGLLGSIFGSGPKWSLVQQKLLGTNVDLAGRAVITPDPDMDMDHIGLPEDKAFDVYKPFVVRQLVRGGMPRVQAIKEHEERSPMARETLVKVMETRPVLVNRYPLLHRFGLMAFYPKLVKGDVIRMSPIVTKPFGADFDGDASQFHVPVSDEAVSDAREKMLPSRNLYSAATFKPTNYIPNMEYTQGLHAASIGHDKGRRPHVFADRKSALAAYRRGDIGHDHPVEIIEP